MHSLIQIMLAAPQTVGTTNDIAGGNLNETPSVFCLVAEEQDGHAFIRQDTQEVAAGDARILEDRNMDDLVSVVE